ncbi:neurotransmitter-gated ion-channel ligand-binding protein [Rhizobium sp. LjRoot30]|uniref:neurotransmitter-gated ion-channel ligand-binding protein n=1 Tax=Rhizobium sp. LjRoot30 TaxID=3342320 RepID=UPI003ED15D43
MLVAAMLLPFLHWTAHAAGAPIPQDISLPVHVHLAVRVLDLSKIDETSGLVSAVIEITQRWNDPTLRFDAIREGKNRKDFVEALAQERLAGIWYPAIETENKSGDARVDATTLSIFASGDVMLIRNIDADFRATIELSAFPFDTQRLVFPLASRLFGVDQVVAIVDDRDRELSSLAEDLTDSDWLPQRLEFSLEQFYGWNSKPVMRVKATATVSRAWPRYVLRIFVPFVAVLSVSLFVLWAPRGFIGDIPGITYSALLALAALSFTFESSFPGSMSVNSPIAFMISLGYFYLILALMADLLLESSRFPFKAAYPYLPQEARRYLRYVLPGVFATVIVATILRASA